MLEQAPMAAFQYAVIEDHQLEQYTGSGWEFVRLIDVLGTEMLHKVDHFEHAQPSQGTYQPPPHLSTYSGESGNFVRWGKVKALVRREREQQALELQVEELKHDLVDAQHNAQLMQDEYDKTLKLSKGLETAVDEQRKGLDSKVSEIARLLQEQRKMQEQLATIELDIGKREMDRILGRFPNPPMSVDLGDDKT